jgi:hypothetical protein
MRAGADAVKPDRDEVQKTVGAPFTLTGRLAVAPPEGRVDFGMRSISIVGEASARRKWPSAGAEPLAGHPPADGLGTGGGRRVATPNRTADVVAWRLTEGSVGTPSRHQAGKGDAHDRVGRLQG